MYDELLDKMGKEALEERIRGKISEFQGLLTREAAMKLIASEEGLIEKEKEAVYSIKDIPRDARGINLIAKVTKILSKVTTTSQKSYRDMQVNDGSGTMTLRLWGKDIDFFSKVKIGDEIEIKNAYEKMDMLSLSFKGEIALHRKAPFMHFGEAKDGEFVNVKGTITKIEGMRPKEGTGKISFAFFVSDGESERRCIIWEMPERGSKLAAGDEIIIENALSKNSELQLSYNSRMLVKSVSAIRGKVEELEPVGEEAKIVVAGRRLVLDRPNALKLLGVSVAKDIALSTILTIKKSFLLNTDVALKGKEAHGKFIFD
jgi:hypothetical protein